MLVRKLTKNFLINAKIETTLKKAKVLKSVVEKLVEKTKVETEANKNFLLSKLEDKKLVIRIFKEVGSNLKDKVGGYVRVIRLGARRSDGSEMARLEWAYPVIKSEEVKKVKPTSHSGKRTE